MTRIVFAPQTAPRWIEIPERLALALLADLSKAGHHKYVRRVLTGKKSPKYRYFYDVTGGAGLGHESEVQVGAKFKGSKESGHWVVEEKTPGRIVLRSDTHGGVQIFEGKPGGPLDPGEGVKGFLQTIHQNLIREKRTRLRRDLKVSWLWGSQKQIARLEGEALRFREMFGKYRGVVIIERPRPAIWDRWKSPSLDRDIQLHDATVKLGAMESEWFYGTQRAIATDWSAGIKAADFPKNLVDFAKTYRANIEEALGIDFSHDDPAAAFKACARRLDNAGTWIGKSGKAELRATFGGFYTMVKHLTEGRDFAPKSPGILETAAAGGDVHAPPKGGPDPTVKMNAMVNFCSLITKFMNLKITDNLLKADSQEPPDATAQAVKHALIIRVRDRHYLRNKGSRKALTWLVEKIGQVNTKQGVDALHQLVANTPDDSALPIKDAKEILGSEGDWVVEFEAKRLSDPIKELKALGYGDVEVVSNRPDPELDSTIDLAIKATKENKTTVSTRNETDGLPRSYQDMIREGQHFMWSGGPGHKAVNEHFLEAYGVGVDLVDRTFTGFMSPDFSAKDKSRWGGDRINGTSLLHADAEERKKLMALIAVADRPRAKQWLKLADQQFGAYSFDPPAWKEKPSRAATAAAKEVKQAAELSVQVQRNVLRDLSSALDDFGAAIGWPIDLSGLPIKVDQQSIAAGANAHYSNAGKGEELAADALQAMGSHGYRETRRHIAVGENRLQKSLGHEIAHYLDNRLSLRVLNANSVLAAVKRDVGDGHTGGTVGLHMEELAKVMEKDGGGGHAGFGGRVFFSNLCQWLVRREAALDSDSGLTPDDTPVGWGWKDDPQLSKRFLGIVREKIKGQPGGAEYLAVFDALRSVPGLLGQFAALDEREKTWRENYFGQNPQSYYASGEEMLARVSEQWLHMKLAQKGRINPSLTHLSYSSQGDRYVKDHEAFKAKVAPAVEAFMKMASKNMTKSSQDATWLQSLLDSLDARPLIKAKVDPGQMGFDFGGGGSSSTKKEPAITVGGSPGKKKQVQGSPKAMSAWQSFGSSIPGAQRQRRGGKYVYRYPAKGGGWTSSKEEAAHHAKKEEPTSGGASEAPKPGQPEVEVKLDPKTGEETVTIEPPKAPPAPHKGLVWQHGRYSADHGYTMVEVPLDTLDGLWKWDLGYLKPGDPGIGDRLAKLREVARAGAVRMDAAEVSYDEKHGRVIVADGRHRIALARELGMKKIRVAVEGPDLDEFMAGVPGAVVVTPPDRVEPPKKVKEALKEKPKVREPDPEPEDAKPEPPPPPPPVEEPKPGPDPDEAEEEPGKYETTGYVFGSKAELARLRREGHLEDNPAVAYKLVTKDAVLNGKVVASSFAAEREAGTEPAAAFLKFKLLKSIASRPPDKPHLREAFIEGLGMLQASMAEAHTLQDMRDLMQEWDDAATGKERIEKISVAEAEARGWGAYLKGPIPYPQTWQEFHVATMKKLAPGSISAMNRAHAQIQAMWFEAKNKWSEKHDGPYKAAIHDIIEHYKEIAGGQRPELRERPDGGGFEVYYDLTRKEDLGAEKKQGMEKARDIFEAFGTSFAGLFRRKVHYRKAGSGWGSLGIVQTPWEKQREEANKNRVRVWGYNETKLWNDVQHEAAEIVGTGSWAWAAEDKSPKAKADRKKKPDYHAILSGKREGQVMREGGKPLEVEGKGAKDVEQELGLHVFEYGGHVKQSDDPMERKFHTENAYAALHDLADVLGVAPEEIGRSKRLSIAIGSRGSGNALAHYEPDTKVINMTRFRGKGSLAHEWGHFLDHMVQVANDPGAGRPGWLSEQPIKGAPRAVDNAMRDVMDAIRYEPGSSSAATRAEKQAEIAKLRKAHSAAAYGVNSDPKLAEELRLKLSTMITEYNANRKTGEFRKETAFYKAAMGMGANYWGTGKELFARCFEAFVYDEMKAKGAMNTYLVKGVDFDPKFPGYFPNGETRKRVSAAMKALVHTLRDSGEFAKSLGFTWGRLLDQVEARGLV